MTPENSLFTFVKPRSQVWLEAWVAVASAGKHGHATYYADECLKDYDSRFPTPSTPTIIPFKHDSPHPSHQ